MTTVYPVIKNPEFIDVEKTKMRFQLINEAGVTSTAEMAVPKNFERGVNTFWDRILDEFDVNELRRQRNIKEVKRKEQEEFDRKKRKAAEENNKLKTLFDSKMKAFELPFISEASDDIKSAVRRAPNQVFLTSVVHEQMMTFMKEKQFNFVQLLDYLDDLEEARLEAEKKLKEETQAKTQTEQTPTQ